ncbi:stage III sporulation protein AF [uncultured Clostridium sp.]|jgi:stage III sporulation protein AF|uniref:stage III sporulation protein AF n=1 Tax=uncultured Clostridium sp. TaxID=59620 RepID=UPI002610439F|nr:stage III sporulation protein AF [uncultured Clostridium sp.]
MDYLKEFVITLTTVSIFIVAVELILPDNSLKKYQNFILSLIMLAVMLTPIIKIFNSDKDLSREIQAAIDKEFKVNGEESFYEGETSSSFIVSRLEDNCKIVLEEKFDGYKFTVVIDGKVDLDDFQMSFNEVIVKVKEKENGNVEKVEEISIGEEKVESEVSKEIKKYMADELKIDEKIISVVEE